MWAAIAKFFSMITYLFGAGEKGAIALDKYASGAVIHASKFERTMEIESGLEVEDLLSQVEAKRLERKKLIEVQKQESDTFDV